MQQPSQAIRPTSAAWRTCLQRLGAWVLDQPLTPALEGQCCDRLRPAQIGRDLTRALARHDFSGCTVVEWTWDQRRQRAEGWLWSNGLLQRFRWQRQDDQLRLRRQLFCGSAPALRPVRPVG